MKPTVPFLLFFTLSVSMTTVASEPAPEEGDSRRPASALEEIELNDGRKWDTDDSLRRGMNAIRHAFVSIHEEVRTGKAGAFDYQYLSDAITVQLDTTSNIVRLNPEARAQAEIIFANLRHAAELLTDSDRPTDGMHLIHDVFVAYGETFEHPGWDPVPDHPGRD